MRKFVNYDVYGESVNVDVINELIYSLYNLLAEYSRKHYIGYYYSYYNPEPLKEKFVKAHQYLDNLQNLKFRVESNSKCLCDKDAGKLIEDTRKLVGTCSPLRLDLIVDSSGEQDWILHNPDRVEREVWETCLYKKCGPITYTLARDLNASKKDCKLVYDLIRTINECNISYDITRSTKNCDLEYQLLVKETKCALTYDEYVEVHNCGVSYDVVKNVINCGATIGVNPSSKCVEVTYNLKKYTIDCYE